MLQQWKSILTNWINCYIYDVNEDKQNLNLDSLLNIITHLRENLNLNESKSSILEAHTVKEFIREKYPDFKFKNGTTEAENEEEIGLSASLLLFFVCVNSKNFDIKNAMCNKLSTEDQETILKFSKSLMGCQVITMREVETAITEACGQNIAAMELSRQFTVAETPPALRSLHSEVRRLQAALDAERFDRYYLQEELSKTNGRLELLLKEKEQHKLDILNLKAKISLCCGEQADAKNTDVAENKSAKLTRQLQQLEERLEETLAQLNDVVYERDSYRAKMDDLKHDRDKWLALSQQETDRVLQLIDELDTEKRHSQSLKDLVAELRQHNRLNGLDTSSLECDDPDASIHSLQHNSSVCSELCANVVEVQLGEERAKIVELKQQIQTLQDQLNELNTKAEAERKNLETVVAQRENDIFNLKHRINEEIEEKNNLKAHCDSEMTKLNNEINELEQQYKDHIEQSSSMTEKKMQEIQTLQEEKLSLIHSLNNETTKLENIIKRLKSEIDSERQARSTMKEGYENHIMKLNEKVLNRNNELVELQNIVFEKGEKIETLQIELREEKEMAEKLKRECHNLHELKKSVETDLRRKCDEVQNSHIKIQQNNTAIEDLKFEVEQLKTSVTSLNENIKILESTKEKLFTEIKTRDIKIEEALQNVHQINEVFKKEKDKLLQDIDEKNATIISLQSQLQNEITFKVGLQKELTQEQITKTTLKEEFDRVNKELSRLNTEIEDKERSINAMDLFIQEEKKLKEQANQKFQEMTDELNYKNNSLKSLNDKLATLTKSLQEQILKNQDNAEVSQNKLLSEIAEKETLNLQLNSLMNEKSLVDKDLVVKCEEILMLRDECQELSQKLDENEFRLKALEEKLDQENKSKSEMSLQKELEIRELTNKITELKILCDKMNEDFTKELDINKQKTHSLEKENEQLQFTIEEDNSNHEILLNDKDKIIDMLEQQLKDNIVKFEDLSRYTEELKISWENYKAETKSALKQKEDKMAQLNEMALNLEQKINEVEQEKGELTKKIVETEESKLMALKNLTSEEKALRDILESEKENNVKENRRLLTERDNLLEYQTLLKKELAEERSYKKIIENEKNKLLSEKEDLLTDKAILAQELIDEKSIKKIAEEEKNILLSEKIETKRQFTKEIEKNKTLLQEKECLTQQLIEERSVKEIIEKEKENIVAEKLLLDERLATNERVNTEFCQELNFLNEKVKVLMRDLKKENENVLILKQEIKNLCEELEKQKTFNNYLLEENQCLITQNDALKIDILNVNSAREVLKAEKVSLENALHHEKMCSQSVRDEIEVEKNNLAINFQLELNNKEEENNNLVEECDKLTKRYEDVKVAQEVLMKEKEIIIQEMKSAQEILEGEKESLHKALNAEKAMRDHVQSEKNAMVAKLELELINKEDLIKELVNEIQQLNADLTEEKSARESLINERDFGIAEKESLVASLSSEKCARDDAESEKKDIEHKLYALEDKYNELHHVVTEFEANLKVKEEEINQLESKLKKMEIDHQDLQGVNTNMSAALQTTFGRLVEKLKNECVSNDILLKLINANNIEDMQLPETFDLLLNVADVLASDVLLKEKLEVSLKNENVALVHMQDILKQKEVQVFELQTEINKLQQVVNENKIDQTKQSETYATSMNSKIRDIQCLQQENQALHTDLNDVRIQLEVKVHSLKEKLVDNENVTDKLKKSYECQIDNLNLMITKLSNYLKEKTLEMETLRKDKDLLQQTVADSCKVIKTLEEEVNTEKQNIDKLISDFESERQVLKNMVTVTESVMEDQKISLTNSITEHVKANASLQEKNSELQNSLKDIDMKCRSQELMNTSLLTLLRLERKGKEDVEKESENVRNFLDEVISYLNKERNTNISVISALEFQEKVMTGDYEKMRNDLESVLKDCKELKKSKEDAQNELKTQSDMLAKVLEDKLSVESSLEEKVKNITDLQQEIKELNNKINNVTKENRDLGDEKRACFANIEELKSQLDAIVVKDNDIAKLKKENHELLRTIEDNKTAIINLEEHIKHELEQNSKLRVEMMQEKVIMTNKCTQLEDHQIETVKQMEVRQKDIISLKAEVDALQSKVDFYEHESKDKDELISKMSKDKDAIISTISKELVNEKSVREKYEKELETQKSIINELKNNMEIQALRKENEQLIRAMGQKETLNALCQEKAVTKYGPLELRDHHQVDNSSSDNMHSSVESLKTITDLEKIIHDKNRTITTLQTDITYLKSLMAESETKVLDLNRELEVTKENCEQLSNQLKKIVYQKNEEIAELKKQVMKMSATENRASQIIKVSAKYQAMILKRIAEIKSNTVLKELTNLGNNNCDGEVRRSLSGTVTMDDLENFLETTDRHIKRCAEKQISLQKERDRLTEVNRINESEIINLRKFLTELSVSFQTFNSLKDLYGQKLSRVISVQRTVRREILNLDGRITDAAMCKLERGYGAVMQDLSECTMNLERWVERCINRTVSVEKIKQAFTSDNERLSLSPLTFQNTGLEIQLDELDKSFQKLLEEVARAAKGEGAKDEQATTVMEIRAEYEDKLNRMKSKMKELFNEQMAVLKNKQREDIALLERELQKTRDRMEESKRAYENHIKDLTKELWTMSEKFLVKNDEAEWLKRKQKSGSLMSLQHVHSSGLVPLQEPPSRPSDAHSLRSLPVNDNTKSKREGRGLHMSDEEGELFDNRYLKELSTPRRETGHRLSELKYRNSLCPPHLKSSYPAETQFTAVLDEEDLKAGSLGGAARSQRKEVGITAYKKPGPPTPSKQAGRLSATDSELRESLRVETEPTNERKTSTPARFRAFLRFNKNDTNEGTPRAKRLSNIFRKKQ